MYPYTLLHTVRVTFPMYSIHEQNDLGSETVRSSFDLQESSTSFKFGLKIEDRLQVPMMQYSVIA